MGLKRQMVLSQILLHIRRSRFKMIFIKRKELKMAKFSVMSYNQKFMTWMGIHSYRLNVPTNEFLNSWATYYILFCLTTCAISTTAYAHKISSQIGATIDLCYLIIASLQAFGMYINLGINMKRVKILHLELQSIVDKGEVYLKF